MDKQASGGKKFGYVLSMLINAALLYVFNHLSNWNIPYLLPTFQGCLWAIRLSLSATIFVNFIYIFFDETWFHHLMQAILNCFSWLSIIFCTAFSRCISSGFVGSDRQIAFIFLLVVIPIEPWWN